MTSVPPDPSIRALSVEIVGVAGAGKSSLARLLHSRYPDALLKPVLRDVVGIPRLAGSTVASAALLATRRSFVRGEMHEQLRMVTHVRVLTATLWRDGRARRFLFDQGPLFYLTRRELRGPRLAEWRREALHAWSGALGAVVWLDADNDVLGKRIDAREKQHLLQGAPDDVRAARLDQERRVLSEVLQVFGSASAPAPVLRFDTGVDSLEEIADRLGGVLEGRFGPTKPM